MNDYYGERVIKPPMENVRSGKIFKPTRAFIFKGWLQAFTFFLFIWTLMILAWVGLSWVINVPDGDWTFLQWIAYLNFWWLFVNMWYWGIASIIMALGFTGWALYVTRIEYSIIAETGETMPEVFVRKGIITVTEKHVPFRTITNISSKKGIYDRLFGIGSVEIQTAGTSAVSPGGGTKPEEKLEGVPYYNEVRDFILRELRKFRAPYVTGTEVVSREEREMMADSSVMSEILRVLREMRDSLRRLEERGL